MGHFSLDIYSEGRKVGIIYLENIFYQISNENLLIMLNGLVSLKRSHLSRLLSQHLALSRGRYNLGQNRPSNRA